jgi:hypothetical protein
MEDLNRMDATTDPAPAEIDFVPDGFLDADARGLHEILAGPTLVHLPGRHARPLFVSALLHGNEDVGLRALQRVLKRFGDAPLPRALSFFVGNVSAARRGLRHLDGAPDYNRVWPGTPDEQLPEAAIMRRVRDAMAERHVFASIDLHNNTGLNPHYACVNSLAPEFLQLASLFSRTVVYFRQPLGVQSAAFAPLCPAVTCECGRTGDESGVIAAADFVEAALHLDAIPTHAVRHGDVHLFHTVATVKVPHGHGMSFDGADADIAFVADLDHYNFRELPAGTPFAQVRGDAGLSARDDAGADVSAKYFTRDGATLRLALPMMPAMLTRDERVVMQDCLCYLMERLALPG